MNHSPNANSMAFNIRNRSERIKQWNADVKAMSFIWIQEIWAGYESFPYLGMHDTSTGER